jgi:hypothetical protein
MTSINEQALSRSLRTLHGLAELLLAGPQFQESGTIRLRVAPGGFATVSSPDVRVEGVELVVGKLRLAVQGRTYSALADAAGLRARPLDDVYSGGPGIRAEEVCVLDNDATRLIHDAFRIGDQALRSFSPGTELTLWPEHFDVAITFDAVNYGVSPGDGFLPEPYAYIGPHQQSEGAFWNAPFGASRTIRELGDAEAVEAFFQEGQTLSRPAQ